MDAPKVIAIGIAVYVIFKKRANSNIGTNFYHEIRQYLHCRYEFNTSQWKAIKDFLSKNLGKNFSS
jgi:hypothetical protein